MAAIVPPGIACGQSEVGFVDDGGRVQRVARPFPDDMKVRQPLEFGVDRPDQFVHGALLAPPDGCEQDFDVIVFAHVRSSPASPRRTEQEMQAGDHDTANCAAAE